MVLVQDPCYPVFADGPALAGAKLYYMPLKKENHYLIRFDEIPEETADRAKFMVVSYPNNPTASMAPESFYPELIRFAKKHDIMVLHDNAYSELVFDGRHCGSFLKFPGASEVGVEFNSLSKTYGLAGARIGFCIGPAMVDTEGLNPTWIRNVHSRAEGAVAALTEIRRVKDTCNAYHRRRDLSATAYLDRWKMEQPYPPFLYGHPFRQLSKEREIRFGPAEQE